MNNPGEARILLVGPGAIGTVWGALLGNAGHTVEVFGRGERLNQVRDQGLTALGRDSGQTVAVAVVTHDRLPVTERYDLILACIRPVHLASLQPELARFPQDIDQVLATNWAGDLQAWGSLGAMAGFPGIVAELVDGQSVYSLAPRLAQPNVFGEPGGGLSPRVRQVCAWFEQAGMPAWAHADIHGWLRCHAAWMAPLNLAVHLVEGDAQRLASDRALQQRLIDAATEGFAVAKAAGHRRSPAWLRVWDAPPAVLVKALMRRAFTLDSMAENIATMGAAGIEEDRVLAEQIIAEADRLGIVRSALASLLDDAVS